MCLFKEAFQFLHSLTRSFGKEISKRVIIPWNPWGIDNRMTLILEGKMHEQKLKRFHFE